MLAAWRCSLLLHDFGANWNKWTISWLYYFSCCWIAKKVILAFLRNEAVWFVIEPLTVPLGSFIMLTFLFLLLCHNIYWMDSLTAQIFMECLKVGNTDSQSFKTQLQTVLSSGFCSMSYIFGSISFIFNFFSECKSCKFLLASWTHQLFICFCGFRYRPLDCLEQLWSWLILASWIFAEMCSCFGSSWLFCFSPLLHQ